MPIIRNVGNSARDIKDYIPRLQRNVFPQLKQYGIAMYDRPFTQDKVSVSYNGETYDGIKLRMYFNCIHEDLDPEIESSVFVDCEYTSKYFPIGAIDVNNGSESAEVIYGSLYEEGYRTEEDKEQDKQAELEKQKQEEEKKKQELEKKKQDRARWKQSLSMETPEEVDDELEDQEQDEIDESQAEFPNLFDQYLDKLRDLNKINNQISVSMLVGIDDSTKPMINVDMYYISAMNCLIQTDNINPKLDQSTTWEKAKNYCLKVAQKLNAYITISAMDDEGKEIKLKPKDDPEVDVGLGID